MKTKILKATGAIAVLFIAAGAYAQPRLLTVTGKVTDSATNEPMWNTSIFILEKETRRGVVADENGNFSIKVEKGDTLMFSYVGYYPKQKIITSKDTVVNVALQKTPNQKFEFDGTY